MKDPTGNLEKCKHNLEPKDCTACWPTILAHRLAWEKKQDPPPTQGKDTCTCEEYGNYHQKRYPDADTRPGLDPDCPLHGGKNKKPKPSRRIQELYFSNRSKGSDHNYAVQDAIIDYLDEREDG